jgi:hypothetical protein
MSITRRCVQWCIIGLLVFSPDLFSASGFVSSKNGIFGCVSGNGFDGLNGGEKTFSFDFSSSTHGWIGGFSDYPQGQALFFELIFDFRPLLPNLNPNRSGLFISGNNHSDDLFMFVKRQVSGLAPNRSYLVDFEVEIGSEAGSDCFGAGGSPAITLKAGASAIGPVAVVDSTGFLRMNIDKGDQSVGGQNAKVLGDIGVDVDCLSPVFKSKQLQSSTGDLLEVITDSSGAVWLIVGTDSSFEGITRLFYTNISAHFSPR